MEDNVFFSDELEQSLKKRLVGVENYVPYRHVSKQTYQYLNRNWSAGFPLQCTTLWERDHPVVTDLRSGMLGHNTCEDKEEEDARQKRKREERDTREQTRKRRKLNLEKDTAKKARDEVDSQATIIISPTPTPPPSESRTQIRFRTAIEEKLTAAVIRRCPTCVTPIVKAGGGCNRLTCRCGTSICWMCGNDITFGAETHLKGMMCGDDSKRDIDYSIKHIRYRGIQKARDMGVIVKMGEMNESQNWMYEDEDEDVKDVLDTQKSAWPGGSMIEGGYVPYERVESGDNFCDDQFGYWLNF